MLLFSSYFNGIFHSPNKGFSAFGLFLILGMNGFVVLSILSANCSWGLCTFLAANRRMFAPFGDFCLLAPGEGCKTQRLLLTLKVLVTTIDAQWEGMGDVGSARYEPELCQNFVLNRCR